MQTQTNGFKVYVTVADAQARVQVLRATDDLLLLDTDALSIAGLENLAKALESASQLVYQELDSYWAPNTKASVQNGAVMRICSGAGCLRTVPDGVRFCDECKPTKTATASDGIREHSNSYDAELDHLRKSERWQRIRKSVLQRDPICKRCDTRLTEEVDHVVPAREAIAQAQAARRFFDKWAGYFFKSNLQGLCRKCHRAKTLEDKAHTGPWPDVLEREDAAPKHRFAF